MRHQLQMDPSSMPAAGKRFRATVVEGTTAPRREELRRLRIDRGLRARSACSGVVLRAGSERELLERLTRVLVQQAGYGAAWIDHGTGGDRAFQCRPAESGANPAGPAVGFALHVDGRRFACLGLALATDDSFEPEEIGLLGELCDEAGYGISALRVRAERETVTAALAERVKELTCLYRSEQILGDRSLSLSRRFANVAAILPQALLDPATSHARIVIGERAWQSRGFREGAARIAAEVIVDGRCIGRIEAHQASRGAGDGTAFLPEETDLLLQLAAQVARSLERQRELRARRLARTRARELQRIISRSPGVVFLWRPDENWKVEFVSPNIRSWGYRPADLLSGEVRYGSLVHPADRERVAAEADRYSREGCNAFVQMYRIVTAAGEVRWVDDRTWVRRDTGGRTTHYEGILLDVTERRHAEEALRRSEQRLAEAQRIAGMGSFEWDVIGDRFHLSDGMCGLLAVPAEDRPGTRAEYLRRVHPDDRAAAAAHLQQVASGSRPWLIEHRVVCPDGSVRVLHSEGTAEHGADGCALRVIGFGQDVTVRKHTEETLRKLSRAVEQSPASVLITDVDGRIEYVNPRLTEVTGYSAREVIGRRPDIWKSGLMPPGVFAEMWQTIAAGGEWRGELYNRRKSGELFWEYCSISPIRSAVGVITHYVAVKEDITERKQYEERLLHQANFDQLTGLPNRILAIDRLGQALARVRRNQTTIAVLFIDLDSFKNVNDTVGHQAGDQVLVAAADRLRGCVRTTDTVARLGGDEFLVILPDLSSAMAARPVAEKVLAAFSRPFHAEGVEFYVTASIGITAAPVDGTEALVLLRNADAAMYRAKEEGRDTIRFFTPELNRRALERLTMESRLRRALDAGDLDLRFQPVIDIANGMVVGAEALLRWRSPELGHVPAAEFIPVAEDTGLIVPIGEWVLRTACAQAARWRSLAPQPLRLCVNLSSRQFRSGDLLSRVSAALDDGGLAPELLDLEVTESLFLRSETETDTALRALTGMGIQLCLDDFGTGYSSLSYLKRFPFRALKIDRSFVGGLPGHGGDAALVSAIIAMAHSLGLRVVAEGVENAGQLAFLRRNRCDHAQGFHFSAPLDAAAFENFVASGRSRYAAPE